MDVTININGNIMVMMEKVTALFESLNQTVNATQNNIQNKVTNNIKNVGKAAEEAAKGTEELSDKLKDVEKAGDAAKEAEKKVDGLQKKLSDIGSAGIGIDFITGKLKALASKIVNTMQTGIDDELSKNNIKVLLKGDAVATDELFSKISDYAKNTVYDKTSLIEAQKTMMSFGLSAEQSYGALQRIGDVAMGDSQNMQGLSLAFAQAASVGKLTGNDWHQMVNAGFNPLQIISEKTGESREKLQKRMSEGKIGINEVAQALEWATEEGGMFYNGATSAADTTAGKINQLKGTIDELKIGIFNAFKPLIDWVLNNVMPIVNWFATKIQAHPKLFAGVAIAVLVLAGALGALFLITKVGTVVTTALSTAQAILNAVMYANPVALIVLGIIALIGVIVFLCLKIKGWGSLWEGVVGFIVHTGKNLFYKFKGWVLGIVYAIENALDQIKIGWYKFKEAIGLGDSSENAAEIRRLEAGIEERQKALAEAAEKAHEEWEAAKGSMANVHLEWKTDEDEEKEDKKEKSNNPLAMFDILGGKPATPEGKDKKDDPLAGTLGTVSNTGSDGGKIKNITVNVNKLVERLEVHTTTLTESTERVKEAISEALLNALNDVNLAVE